MLSFLKKKNFLPSAFPYTQDLHSHILPGIDDGAPDVETSLVLIKGMQALGITSAIATPHIASHSWPNTEETISAAHSLITAALEKEGNDFKVSYAAEYLMDDVFFEKLRKGEKLLTFKGNHVLTEFSFSTPPFSIEKYAYEISMEGYQPILAHPERFSFFNNNFDNYHRLAELGFLLQANILSITGYYGPAAAKAARYLIDNNLLSFVGSDLHHTRGLASMQDADNRKLISETYLAANFNANLVTPLL